MKRGRPTLLITPEDVEEARQRNQKRRVTSRANRRATGRLGTNSEQRARFLEGVPVSTTNITTREDQLQDEIARSIVQTERPLGVAFDPNDSYLENYLRAVSFDTKSGVKVAVVRSVMEILQQHADIMGMISKMESLSLQRLHDYTQDEVLAKMNGIDVNYVNNNHFLDAPDGNKQRPCSRGNQCLGVVMSVRPPGCIDTLPEGTGFMVREWLLPFQLERFQRDQRLPDYPRMCLVCNRAATNVLAIKAMQAGVQHPPYHVEPTDSEAASTKRNRETGRSLDGLVRRFMREWESAGLEMNKMFVCMDHHYVNLDKPGHYKREACLPICPKGLKTSTPYHFLGFATNRYEYAKRANGRPYLRESNVFYREPGSGRGASASSSGRLFQ